MTAKKTARKEVRKVTQPFGVVTKSGKYVGPAILNQYATKAEPRKLKDNFAAQYSAEKLIEPLYNPESLAKLLEINTYHYRAVKTKARDTAGNGWELKERDDTDDEDANREGDAVVSAAVKALDDFLTNLTPPLPVVLDRAQTDYEAIGWGCLELVRDQYATEGPYADMEHVPAHTIRLHRDGIRVLQKRGIKKRWFKLIGSAVDVDAETGEVFPLGELEAERRATEILFYTNYTPRSDYYGLSDVMPSLGAVQGEIARRDYNIAFFDNFGVPAYAVFITGDFEEEVEIDEDGNEYSLLQETIEGHFRELAKNPHSTLVLTVPGSNVEITFHPLATDVKEASFRLYRADNRDEVLAAHGVPPYRAGIAETGSLGGSTARESTEIYKRSVIEPRQALIEHYFNKYIVQEAFGVTDREFKLNPLDTRDEAHDMTMMIQLVNAGAMDREELREAWAKRFGLKPRLAEPETEDVPQTELDDILATAPAETLERMAAQAFDRVMKMREDNDDKRALRVVSG